DVREQTDGLEEVVDLYRLEDVELEVALRAGEPDGGIVAQHLAAHHGERLRLSRIDLPRHDRAARLVLRDADLPQPAAGTARQPADVVGDLHESGGQHLGRAGRFHDRVVGGEGGELVL